MNQVRNKNQKRNILHASDFVMNLYSDYISSLEQHKLIEYVFINFYNYNPLGYSAVKKWASIFGSTCYAFNLLSYFYRITDGISFIRD